MQDIIEEIGFQHMDHIRAVLNPTATYLGTLWYIRWIIFTVIAAALYQKTRTAYLIFTILDLIFVVLSALSLEAYHKPTGILIIVEEIAIFIWHLLQLLLFNDLEKGGNFSSGLVWTFVIIIFICYIAVILIEIVLVGFSMVSRVADKGQRSIGERRGERHQEPPKMSARDLHTMPTKTHGQDVPKPDRMGI